jgi:hypothetical protein
MQTIKTLPIPTVEVSLKIRDTELDAWRRRYYASEENTHTSRLPHFTELCDREKK